MENINPNYKFEQIRTRDGSHDFAVTRDNDTFISISDPGKVWKAEDIASRRPAKDIPSQLKEKCAGILDTEASMEKAKYVASDLKQYFQDLSAKMLRTTTKSDQYVGLQEYMRKYLDLDKGAFDELKRGYSLEYVSGADFDRELSVNVNGEYNLALSGEKLSNLDITDRFPANDISDNYRDQCYNFALTSQIIDTTDLAISEMDDNLYYATMDASKYYGDWQLEGEQEYEDWKQSMQELDEAGKTKVFWFSRHEMTEAQKEDLHERLGDVEITQFDKAVKSAYEVENEVKNSDVVAVVAPLQLQQQFLKIAGDRPVIMPANEKVMVPQPDGRDSKAEFVFDKWEQLDEINVRKHDFDFEKDDEPHKVFWFSKHDMTEFQKADLKEKLGDDVEIVQYGKNISSAYEVMDDARDCDVLAVAAPIQLQQQFLKIAEDRPVIMDVNNRWQQLDEINVEKHDFVGIERDSPDLDFDNEER